jgi:hypothetical protein
MLSAFAGCRSGVSSGKVGASAPPSISMTLPVTLLAAGEASHLAVFATSATVLSRRSGVAETIRRRRRAHPLHRAGARH